MNIMYVYMCIIHVYINSQSFLNYRSVLYRGRKSVTLSKKLLLRPFYCCYNLTCSISVHVQTLNEYMDAKNTFGYQNNKRIFEHNEYLLHP